MMTNSKGLNRRAALQTLGAVGLGTATFQRALAAQVEAAQGITIEMIKEAEWISDIELSDQQREGIARSLENNQRSARKLRESEVDADTVPALVFRPDFFYAAGKLNENRKATTQVSWSVDTATERLPDDELAFASIRQQSSLLARGELSSRELTEIYLKRLKRFDPVLHCVITPLEEHAMELASASDERRRRGGALGILDGIPWVAKDLIAIPPWKTTWGAEPFRDQTREKTATVANKLKRSGAVLLAKVSLGALAWGDVWFDGKTRNPWNPKQGSSGSSAGSAAAVAAGLASFALGSETLGSIVSPTRRCRTSGLRPTFGRVSRAGCMPLAWSMDKIGPIARHVDDLAHVFPALLGVDGRDPTLVERDYTWPIDRSIQSLRIGADLRLLTKTEEQALSILTDAGAEVLPFDLETDLPVDAMGFILGVEASTVFDDAFRSDLNADYGLWPKTFRESQFIPAVQYLRANRLRGQLIEEAEQKLQQVDCVLGGSDLLLTNLTGHPSIVVSCGTEQSNAESGIGPMPGVVKLTASAYREDQLLHVGHFLQHAMPPRPAAPQISTDSAEP